MRNSFDKHYFQRRHASARPFENVFACKIKQVGNAVFYIRKVIKVSKSIFANGCQRFG